MQELQQYFSLAAYMTDTRNVDVTGLNDNEIELVSQLVDMLRNKK